MPKLIDLTGQRFGRLFVIERAPNRKSTGNAFWYCRCDCGNEPSVMGSHLKSGYTQSCGCLRSVVTAREKTIHGHSSSTEWSPTYHSWSRMIQRVRKQYHEAKYYADQGVTVCDRWRNFENFLTDMGERPPGRSLDRWPNSDGDYEPGNCRWATPKEQYWNRRDVKARRGHV